MDDFLDEMFDLDNDGELDDEEKAAEVSFITEDFTEDEDNEDYDDEYDEYDDED